MENIYYVYVYLECQEEALKYETLNEFKNKSAGAYHSSFRHGWYYEITAHIKRNN